MRSASRHVAQPLHAVARHVMPDLVTEHGRKLRFIVDAQHEPAPDLHHAVGRHGGVEVRSAHEMHADIGTVLAAQAAGDVLHVGARLRVAQIEGTAPQACLLAIHQRPQAAFVGRDVRPREARRGLPALGERRGRQQPRAARATCAQERASSHFGAGNPASRAFDGLGRLVRLAQVAGAAHQPVEPEHAPGFELHQRGIAGLHAAAHADPDQRERDHRDDALAAGVAVAHPGEQRVVRAGRFLDCAGRVAQRPVELAVLGRQPEVAGPEVVHRDGAGDRAMERVDLVELVGVLLRQLDHVELERLLLLLDECSLEMPRHRLGPVGLGLGHAARADREELDVGRHDGRQ